MSSFVLKISARGHDAVDVILDVEVREIHQVLQFGPTRLHGRRRTDRRGVHFAGYHRGDRFRGTAGLHHRDIALGIDAGLRSAMRDARSDWVPKRVVPNIFPLKSSMRLMLGWANIHQLNFFAMVARIDRVRAGKGGLIGPAPPAWMIGNSPDTSLGARASCPEC